MKRRFPIHVTTGWIGFQGKTLWDWIQLLIIPGLLGVGALIFNTRNAQTQLEIAADSQYESALQDYIDDMSTLLLDNNLRTSAVDSEPRIIARTRTLAVLRALDVDRKRTVLEFLTETQLISGTTPVIAMNFADLSGVDLLNTDLSGLTLPSVKLVGVTLDNATLVGTNLDGADLSGASLTTADLTGATLSNADLTGANLTNANLTEANLTNADLTDTTLTGAQVTDEQLAQARSGTDTTLPDEYKQ